MLKTELSIETQIHERTGRERDDQSKKRNPLEVSRLQEENERKKKVQNLDSCRSHSCFEFSVKIPFLHQPNKTKHSVTRKNSSKHQTFRQLVKQNPQNNPNGHSPLIEQPKFSSFFGSKSTPFFPFAGRRRF
jgi:hypothetical protein